MAFALRQEDRLNLGPEGLVVQSRRSPRAGVPGACARRKAGCWVSNAATNTSNTAMGMALFLLNSSLALLRELATGLDAAGRRLKDHAPRINS